MTDTAQPFVAAETDKLTQLDQAADAFKAATSNAPVTPRDESGRFAPLEAVEAEEPDAIGDDDAGDIEEGEPEAAEEAQPLPPSWPEDQAEHWQTLPAETQDFILAREAERERAVQAKFQESANARREALAERDQTKATRTQLAEVLDVLSSAIQPVKPDARAYGAGTGQYNREAYDYALAEYEQQATALAQLTEQRRAIQEQDQAESRAAFLAHKQEVEAQYAPKLLADVPELQNDPVKGEQTLRAMVDYAVQVGIPGDVFSNENAETLTSPELHILWKAMQYDKLRANPPQAKPKPASPAVKPGVSSPRSAQKVARHQQVRDRLAREGSVEAGAAMWKSFIR